MRLEFNLWKESVGIKSVVSLIILTGRSRQMPEANLGRKVCGVGGQWYGTEKNLDNHGEVLVKTLVESR